ncbi:MAG TPA: hypothetical protein VFI39_07745 [Gemmatimonadales bacterium]|nr:hypothetical protein [Gemmatimonadales bacterium]
MSHAGMPASLALDEFGALVEAVFGEHPYHVGSSVTEKHWRDVDVRLILDDEQYDRWGFGHVNEPFINGKWIALVRAFSALGKEMTGLPIDFQIQRQTQANGQYQGPRHALGLTVLIRWQDRFKPSATAKRPTRRTKGRAK